MRETTRRFRFRPSRGGVRHPPFYVNDAPACSPPLAGLVRIWDRRRYNNCSAPDGGRIDEHPRPSWRGRGAEAPRPRPPPDVGAAPAERPARLPHRAAAHARRDPRLAAMGSGRSGAPQARRGFGHAPLRTPRRPFPPHPPHPPPGLREPRPTARGAPFRVPVVAMGAPSIGDSAAASFGLAGKTAIVTGGTKGIGRSVAVSLVRGPLRARRPRYLASPRDGA